MNSEKEAILNSFLKEILENENEKFRLSPRQSGSTLTARASTGDNIILKDNNNTSNSNTNNGSDTIRSDNMSLLKYRKQFLSEEYQRGEMEFLGLKFLVARNWDLKGGLEMYSKYKKFERNELQIALDLDYTERDRVFELYPHYYHKSCKMGRPIQINQFGKLDVKKLFTITTKERFLQDHIRDIYTLTYSILPASTRGRPFSAKEAGFVTPAKRQLFNIVDLKGVALSDFMAVKSVLEALINLDGEMFPETLGCMVIINAPWIFTSMFAIIKQFLDAKTIAKIHILGANYRSELLRLVDADNLPVAYGGTCVCPSGCETSSRKVKTTPSASLI